MFDILSSLSSSSGFIASWLNLISVLAILSLSILMALLSGGPVVNGCPVVTACITVPVVSLLVEISRFRVFYEMLMTLALIELTES